MTAPPRRARGPSAALVALATLSSCVGPRGPVGPEGDAGQDGAPGEPGDDGATGSSCSVVGVPDGGAAIITCDDGTTEVIEPRRGETSVVRFDDEPAGANCEHGGVAVRSGLDDDRDGRLDDVEIDDTAYLCAPPVSCGNGQDLYVQVPADLNALDGCEDFVGNLTFTGSGITSLAALASLQRVAGDVTFTSAYGLLSFAGLDALDEIGGSLSITDHQGVVVDGFPALATIGGDLIVRANPFIEDISAFDALAAVGGLFEITANPRLVTPLTFPNLVGLGGLYFSENNDATAVPALPATSSRSITVTQQPFIASLAGLGSLQTIGVILTVAQNAALTSLAMPALVSTDNLVIIDNPSLPQCEVTTLVARLPPSTNVTTYGNDDFGPCP